MTLQDLREQVCEANRALEPSGLVRLTWGNVSGIDRASGLWAIKPSGVDYLELTPEDMVVLDLEGRVVEGKLRPSSDTKTHLVLYREFPEIGGITHTHSLHATMFSQAGRELPCYGTTHADHFHGTVPIVRALTPAEVAEDYEHFTGVAIVERLRELQLSPLEMPAVLQLHHAPFTFGKNAMDSLKNSIALEMCANMALGASALNPAIGQIPAHILEKHYLRKHGPGAYYGQK
ncbi:L-ribulose-5-phosphate 4-epimerase AraD [Prosthecobacter vanneervenii]|uniref:L-ribulose-5-phosphate 4-epimerase n=1 Tax=Prosthecobacter vanneervenii TaxID=48466 RepID=A0A7W7Y9L0_9BACT|nr:L-ribulose-5-phosphate 4-epimerase AraD [Prosthecobacter vanneervenii]MBB5032168.1 L-ribulose-5-phosphate 4-epimerase [Prosthecobacter vanneervenii]